MILDELLVALGFEYDPKEVKQFKDDIKKTTNIIASLVKAAAAGATAITGMTIASTRASDEQGKLANEIGETVENISALQFAQQRAGGSTEEMTSSLRDLSIRAAEAARGVGSGVEAFGVLGISATDVKGKLKPASDLLLEVSQRFQGLDKARQIELAGKLGLRGSIRLLQQGPDAIGELTKEAALLGITTSEDAAIAEEFQDSLVDLWAVIKQVARVLTRTFAPILNELVSSFTEWWKVNKNLIESNIPQWIDKLTMAFKLLTIAVGAFVAYKLVTLLTGLIGVLRGATLATLALNAAAFLIPALIAAGIAAIALLAGDAKTFFEGGDSFIGSMIEKYPKWASELRVVAAVFATMADLTTMIFDGWSKIIKLFSDGNFLDTLKGITSDAFILDALGLVNVGGGGAIPELGNKMSSTASTIVDKIEIVIQGGIDSADRIAESVYNKFQQATQDLDSAVDQ